MYGRLHAEIEKQHLLIQRLVRQQFGRRSEKLSPDQLQLGLEDFEQDIAAHRWAGFVLARRLCGLRKKTPRQA